MIIKKISHKLKNVGKGESRVLISNFLSLSFLQVAGYIFPLLTIPYLAHVIGIDKYGEIAFASAIMIYFQTLVDYGFIFSAVRDIARCRDDKNEVSRIYSRVMWARFFLVLVSFLILVLCIALIPKLYVMRWLLLASFFIVIGHALFPDWIFQAVEKMKYITLFNVLIKLLFTGAVFLFIHKPEDYILQPIFTSLGYILSGIAAIFLIHRWNIKFLRPNISEIRKCLKDNTDLFINQLVPNLYNSASVLLLGFMHGDAANGIFDAASRFNTAGERFFSIFSRTFYPFLSRRMDKHNFYCKLNLSIAFLVAFSLFLTAPLIIHKFFPPDFDGAINVLRIISISLIFLAMNNIFGTNFLILKGYEREIRQITLRASILGLLFGIPAVYYGSYLGVAFTILFARGIMGISCYFKVKKLKIKES